jgi:hypothetical protein
VRFIQEDIEREMKKAIREGKLKLVVETHDGRTIEYDLRRRNEK